MSETRNQSYKDLLPTIKTKRQIVFNEILKSISGLTLFEIAFNLQWPINSVSGRVTELKKLKIIKESGATRVNPSSGKYCRVFKVI